MLLKFGFFHRLNVSTGELDPKFDMISALVDNMIHIADPRHDQHSAESSSWSLSARSRFSSGGNLLQVMKLKDDILKILANAFDIRYVVMDYTAMAYIARAYIVMAYIVMAYRGMAYIDMVYIDMAYIVMAYIVMAYKLKDDMLKILANAMNENEK